MAANEANVQRPYIIGLTGNIACGKSTVGRMLVARGADYIDADRLVHALMEPAAAENARIVERFGPTVRAPGGRIDRARLGAIVFADPAALRDLEAILHPRVRGEIRSRLSELSVGGVEIVAVEVIKLLESPLADACDEIWVVRCEEADAIARLAASRGMDEAAARRRLANQSSQDEKVAAADVVIDGSAPIVETRRQVEDALAALRERG